MAEIVTEKQFHHGDTEGTEGYFLVIQSGDGDWIINSVSFVALR
jgi:hypothetical protein